MSWNFFKKLSGKHNRVFLDYASATPVRMEVKKLMNALENFANPSALYTEARDAKELLDAARTEAARFLNTAYQNIVFTSGGTEGNNMAILGVFEAARKNGIAEPHIISVLTEHPSVREVLEEVVRRGGRVTLLSPDTEGRISPAEVVEAITEYTVLVSVMYANNEIGVIQPIREIAQVIKSYKQDYKPHAAKRTSYPYFHTDACQAALFYTLDVSTLGVDLLTLDGLKIGGPHGSGLLFVKHGTQISPIIFGGGQEQGLRSGTEHVLHARGLAKALTLAKDERKELSEQLLQLQDYFFKEIAKRFPYAEVNGSRTHRVPNNINICFPGVDAEYLVVCLDMYGLAASYSSSCRTLKEDSSSYVVESLGKKECALSSIRFTLGRETTKGDIDAAVKILEKALTQVKK